MNSSVITHCSFFSCIVVADLKHNFMTFWWHFVTLFLGAYNRHKQLVSDGENAHKQWIKHCTVNDGTCEGQKDGIKMFSLFCLFTNWSYALDSHLLCLSVHCSVCVSWIDSRSARDQHVFVGTHVFMIK